MAFIFPFIHTICKFLFCLPVTIKVLRETRGNKQYLYVSLIGHLDSCKSDEIGSAHGRCILNSVSLQLPYSWQVEGNMDLRLLVITTASFLAAMCLMVHATSKVRM
jgi:hypothetical protein